MRRAFPTGLSASRRLARSAATAPQFASRSKAAARHRHRSELQWARRRLHEKERSLQITLDKMLHGFVAIDESGRVRLHNLRAIELLDLPPAFFAKGRQFSDAIRFQTERGDFGHGFQRIDPETLQSIPVPAGSEPPREYVRKTTEGSYIEVRTLDLPDGGWVQTYSDVTPYFRSQESLRHSELELRTLLEGFPGLMVVTDSNLNYTYLNDRGADWIGRPRESLIGQPIHENMSGERFEQIADFIRNARTGEQVTVESVYAATEDSPQRWLQVTQVIGGDGAGSDRKCYAFAVDITRQKNAEVAIVAAKEEAERARVASDRLRILADEARSNLQRLSEFGRRVAASLDLEVILATLRDGLPGLIPADGLRVLVVDAAGRLQPVGAAFGEAAEDPEDTDDHLRELQECLDGARVVTLARADESPAWRHAPDGARSALAAPLISQQGPIGLLVVYSGARARPSATHLAMLETLSLHVASAMSNSRAYAQLQLAQAQLVEREKMAALGSLVAGVAHELNTPLGNALLLTSTLIERVGELPAALASGKGAEETLTELRQWVMRAGGLIERSLRSAAILVSSFKQVAVDQTADRRRTFDLAEVVGELAATMHNKLQPQRHELELQIPPGIEMNSYPGSLMQVLTNLMLNAIQHGFDGRTEGHISISAVLRRDEVVIEFSDDGHGISAAHLRRVFEPFFTTRLGRGGTGLGLSISYNIVTAVLGGSIQVSSPVGGGALFRLVIPAVATERGAGSHQPVAGAVVR